MTPEHRASMLAQADGDALVRLADRFLADHGARVEVVSPPEVGLRVFQVREPIERTRFNLADVMVTEAAVKVGDHVGWASRLGEDREATLAAAILEAFAAAGLGDAPAIEALCIDTADRVAETERVRRAQVAATEVRFEELD